MNSTHLRKGIVLVLLLSMVLGITSIVYAEKQETKISAEEYGKNAINIMNKNGLYSNTKEWKVAKEKALKDLKHTKTYEDTYPILEKAIKVAGGKHSSVSIKPTIDTSKEKAEKEYPKSSYKNNILTLKMPSYMGTSEEGQKYADTLANTIITSKNLKGVVVDLSENGGGDMGPMLAGLAPLLPDGDLMYFETNKITSPVKLVNGRIVGGGTPTKARVGHIKVSVPVAIITGEKTASSAEATLVSFMGLDYVKTFGKPTAGYATGNVVMPLSNGAKLILTTSRDKARTGDVFDENPIKPDVVTEKPYEEAVKWIEEQVSK